MIVLKWLYDASSAKHLEFSPLLAGVIAAEVFIVGFMLSGTAGDFKEAERLPGELAASLETVADECLIIDAELKLPEARQCVAQLVEIGHSVHRWLLQNKGFDEVMADLRTLKLAVHRVRAEDPGWLHDSVEVRAERPCAGW